MVMGGEFVDFETNALLYGNEAGVHFAESGRVSSRPLSTRRPDHLGPDQVRLPLALAAGRRASPATAPDSSQTP